MKTSYVFFWGFRYRYYAFSNKRREVIRNDFNSKRAAVQELSKIQSEINNNSLTDNNITVVKWYQINIDINKANAECKNGN